MTVGKSDQVIPTKWAITIALTVLGMIGGIFVSSVVVAISAGESLSRLGNLETTISEVRIDLKAHLRQFSGEQARITILERDLAAVEDRVTKLERTASAESKQ